MFMKRFTILLFAGIIFASCGNSEKQARGLLDEAGRAVEQQNYTRAKMLVDSIRAAYPKAFDVRREAIALRQRADLLEQQRTIAYLDSMEAVAASMLGDAEKGLVMEKDTAWQEVGNYMSPQHSVEKTHGRSFLRPQVDERGDMSFTSFYCGTIGHDRVRVECGSEFAESGTTSDTYSSTNLGVPLEQATFDKSSGGDVCAFIARHAGDRIFVKFVGSRSYRNEMSRADKEAFVRVYKLAGVLSSIENIKAMRKEALRKIEFVKRKMEESDIGSDV